ncbi:hypothetical protein HY29_01105 [Hyphomonas beringensis]|uniref:Uncharacterized protein n=1 Tax=Hyphomonas beringensis TaxID=1280946 RepID=A0A062UL97_9PROT|nr:hypothetical protein HY29_01105 [Hyphomonas beringensis]
MIISLDYATESNSLLRLVDSEDMQESQARRMDHSGNTALQHDFFGSIIQGVEIGIGKIGHVG